MMHAPNEHRSLLVEIDAEGKKGLAQVTGAPSNIPVAGDRFAYSGDLSSSAVPVLLLVGVSLPTELDQPVD
jgi:hypothetical protein